MCKQTPGLRQFLNNLLKREQEGFVPPCHYSEAGARGVAGEWGFGERADIGWDGFGTGVTKPNAYYLVLKAPRLCG